MATKNHSFDHPSTRPTEGVATNATMCGPDSTGVSLRTNHMFVTSISQHAGPVVVPVKNIYFVGTDQEEAVKFGTASYDLGEATEAARQELESEEYWYSELEHTDLPPEHTYRNIYCFKLLAAPPDVVTVALDN